MFKYTAEKLFKNIFCFLLILSIGIICSGCKNNITITSDFDTYLKSDSTFNKNIKGVLPSQEELKNAKIVFYMLYDDNDTEKIFANSMIRLTVKYSADDFKKPKIRWNSYQEEIRIAAFIMTEFYIKALSIIMTYIMR